MSDTNSLPPSIPDEIISHFLGALVEHPDFDNACLDRINRLAARGELALAERVLQALAEIEADAA